MEKKGVSTEIKVGIFVLIGLVILGYMTLKLEKFKFKEAKGYDIYALFDSASGLVISSPVQIAGIEVGRVKDIRLAGDQATVIMTIRKEVPVYSDARAVLRTQGVLGDKYIEIYPGSDKTPRLLAGGTIKDTRSTIELDHLLAKAIPAMDDIRSVTRSLSEVLGTEEGKNNLRETFFNIKKTTEDIRSMTVGLSHGEGTMGKLIRDDALYNEMRATVTGIKDTVAEVREGKGSIGKFFKDDEFYDQTKKTMTSLEKVANKIDAGEGTLGKLVNDDSLYKEAKETMTKLNQTAASLNQTAQKINQGEGTLGKLVNDDSLYKETKYTLRSVTKATEGLSEQVPVSILGTIIGTIIK